MIITKSVKNGGFMNGTYLIFFGILFILYANGDITLTQLFILLALISTVPNCCCNNNNTNSTTTFSSANS